MKHNSLKKLHLKKIKITRLTDFKNIQGGLSFPERYTIDEATIPKFSYNCDITRDGTKNSPSTLNCISNL